MKLIMNAAFGGWYTPMRSSSTANRMPQRIILCIKTLLYNFACRVLLFAINRISTMPTARNVAGMIG